MSKDAEINFVVTLDEDHVPDSIKWSASESEFKGHRQCESLLISMWDKSEKNTMSIDLWTKKMEVGDMNAHFYYTLMKMADTYQNATNNQELADSIRAFANDFASKVKEFTTKDT